MNDEYKKIAEVTVEKLKVEDGDLIIVTVSKGIPPEQAASLASGLRSLLSEMGKAAEVAVVADDISVTFVKEERLAGINARLKAIERTLHMAGIDVI